MAVKVTCFILALAVVSYGYPSCVERDNDNQSGAGSNRGLSGHPATGTSYSMRQGQEGYTRSRHGQSETLPKIQARFPDQDEEELLEPSQQSEQSPQTKGRSSGPYQPQQQHSPQGPSLYSDSYQSPYEHTAQNQGRFVGPHQSPPGYYTPQNHGQYTRPHSQQSHDTNSRPFISLPNHDSYYGPPQSQSVHGPSQYQNRPTPGTYPSNQGYINGQNYYGPGGPTSGRYTQGEPSYYNRPPSRPSQTIYHSAPAATHGDQNPQSTYDGYTG